MDLTIEDLRHELEKRGLDSAGEHQDLQSRFEQALENEKEEQSVEADQTDTSEKNPESEDVTEIVDKKEEDQVQETAMVAIPEGEEEVPKKETDDNDNVDAEAEAEAEKTENSKDQSLPPSSTEETDGKDLTDPTLGNTASQEKTTENNDDDNNADDNNAVTTGDNNNTVAETKDSTANPPTTKGEENESLIVLVDDTQNDLDADLLAKEKAINKNKGKKSEDAADTEGGDNNSGPSGVEATSNEDGGGGGGGDKGNTEVKTEKKADEKKDDKDGKLKSSSTVPRVKSTKNGSNANQNSCNLWISGLSSSTKATHLKGIFTKHGKVLGAKLVTNSRLPGGQFYGFLTMSSPEEAAKCIQHLNQTKINNQTVTVKSAKTTPGLKPLKKARPETKLTPKKDATKSDAKSPHKKPAVKRNIDKKYEGNSSNKKHLDKSPVKKPVGKPADKKTLRVEPKKDGKSQSEKGDIHSKKPSRSLDRSKVLSPRESKTPSKSSSSHSPRRHHRSREHSSENLDRDLKLTLELKQRKNYLKREVRRQERQIDYARLVELELQRRQKEEAYRLERAREELRLEREKLERERLKLERAERKQVDMFNGYERERHTMKRAYDRKTSHNDNFWDEPKRPNLGGSGASSSRFSRSFSHETWYGDIKETYDRRGDSYYNRDNKPMESVSRFSDSNMGRMNHSPQRSGHERYGPPESSSRLADHVSSDNRFERRDVSSVGYHGHDTDHRNLSDRGREMDRRNVSAHERLGRIRSQPVGGSNWKVDNWSHSHSMDTGGHQWMSNNMNQNYERGNSSGVGGGRGGFVTGSGSSSSGLAQNVGMGNMFNTVAQPPGMMATGGGGGGGGGSNLGSRMQEPRFDAYKNMDHGGMRRY